MIDTGMTTKNWATSEQKPGFKKDATQFLSATQQDNGMNGQDLESMLNTVADPNWVDKSKTQRAGKSELGKDAFFKLMLAQIKNQDPTSPMQSHEMAAHLAQFTSLEQLYNVNENLAGLKRTQDPMANYQALNFLGKTISSDSSRIVRTKGDTKHEVFYQIPKDAQEVNVTVMDASGAEIRKMKFNNVKKGDVRFSWNGNSNDGTTTNAGEYNVKIEATDGDNKKIAVKTNFTGKVTGVNFANGSPVLLMGEQTIKLSDIKKIEDETLKTPEKKSVSKQGDQQQGAEAGAAVKSELADLVNKMQAGQAPEGGKKL